MAYYGYPYNGMVAPQNPPLSGYVPQTPVSAQSYQIDPMIQVQGIGAAKAYNVPPNGRAVLWDSEAQTIYVKQVDAVGHPTLTILDYTIREAEKAAPDVLKALSDRISVLEKKLGGMMNEQVVSNDAAVPNA